MASPAWKTGKFSKFLPTRLLSRYQDALNDSELLALRDEIALLDTRLAELISRVNTEESHSSYRSLQKLYVKFERAMQGESDGKKRETLSNLRTAIWDGAADYGIWQDIQVIIENRRRVVESERKRLVEMQQLVTSEQAMMLITALSSVIREHVKDRDALSAISNEFIKLANRQSSTANIA